MITPTDRLVRVLRDQYTECQRKRNVTVWETPDILKWDIWVKQLWEYYSGTHPSPLLLNATQSGFMWQEIVNKSEEGRHAVHPVPLAKQSYKAFELARDWLLPIFPDSFDETQISHDAHAFREWVTAYEAWCREAGWLDPADLEAMLTQHLSEAVVAYHAARLCVFGFDEIKPSQKRLLETLTRLGSEVIELAPPAYSGNQVTYTTFSDSRSEYTAVSHFARAAYEDLESEHDDGQFSIRPIAIIASDLATCGEELRHCLDMVFMPDGGLSNGDAQRLPYHLSLGQPLLDYPMIQAAFMILALPLPPNMVPFETFSALLRSPFIGVAEDEMNVRAEWDAKLRRAGNPMITRLEMPPTRTEWPATLTAGLSVTTSGARWRRHCLIRKPVVGG